MKQFSFQQDLVPKYNEERKFFWRPVHNILPWNFYVSGSDKSTTSYIYVQHLIIT